MAKDHEQSTRGGVEDAWLWWLGQHPVSVPEIIEAAIDKSFSKWLDKHKDEILELVAERLKQ